MATQTTNYGLTKQAQSEYYNSDIASENMDIIDEQLAAKVNKDGSIPMANLTIGTRKSGSVVGVHSFSQGTNVEASGDDSSAVGRDTIATGINAIAEGNSTAAVTNHAHASGLYTLASNGAAYIITNFNDTTKTITLNYVGGLVVGDKLDITSSTAKPIAEVPITAINGLAVTLNTTEILSVTHTVAIKRNVEQYPTHAEGRNTLASGTNSHSEGSVTKAIGHSAHSEGYGTVAIGQHSHAEGHVSMAYTSLSHADGYCNLACSGTLYIITTFNDTAKTITLNSVTGLIVGDTIVVKRTDAIALITTISAINGLVVTVATFETINSAWIHLIKPDTGYSTHAEGYCNTASGARSHVEGFLSLASGGSSHAEGDHSVSSGYSSHAEGTLNTASGDASHAEGTSTVASGIRAHAEGGYTTASNTHDHAEGYCTIANGGESHAGGYGSEATANQSFAHGLYAKANGAQQTVFGRYNVPDTTSLFIIGMGTSDSNRRNAFRVSSIGSQFQTFASISSYTTEVDVNSFLGTYSDSSLPTTHYTTCFDMTVSHSILGGGTYYLDGFKVSNDFEWQELTSYTATGIRRFVRSKYAGSWNAWVAK